MTKSSPGTAGQEAARALSIVPDLLRLRALEAPAVLACTVDGGGALTVMEWEERSSALARGLRRRGVVPGDRVALRFDRSAWIDLAVSYFGVLKAGGVAVPLADSLAPAELEDLLARCAPVGVIGAGHLLPEDRRDGRWMARPAAVAAGQSGAPLVAPVGPRDPADILYTSGTTGAPLGVVSTHEQLLALHAAPQALPALRMPDGGQVTVLHAMPVGTTAMMQLLLVPLVIGWRVLAMPAFDPARFWALIESHRLSVAVIVPSMAPGLLDPAAHRGRDLSSLRILASGSAVMPAATLERLQRLLPDALLMNAYGLTETGGAGTAMIYYAGRPGSVGTPRQDSVGVAVRGPDGMELPAGEVGEIALRLEGAGTRTYFGDPVATARIFQGGWVRTGDLGYLDADGYLYVVDRLKDIVVSGGIKVSTLEVEAAIAQHPAVRDVAVVGEPHPVLGEGLAAVVVLRDEVSGADLRRFLSERLSPNKLPWRIVFVDELPRGPAGKVKKGVVRDLLAAPAPVLPRRPPATATEARLLETWRGLFGREDIGVDDDFFSLGGHSLLAMRLLATIKTTFGVELDAASLLERPTVEELARAVDKAAGAPGGVPARRPPRSHGRRAAAIALYDPADPLFRADPYPVYQRLRELEPLHRSHAGFWALSRYADVVSALGDDRFALAAPERAAGDGRDPAREAAAAMWAVLSDPAAHRRFSSAIAGYFTPDTVAALCSHVATVAGDTVRALAGHEVVDLVADYAKPLAARMLADVLGTPPERRAACREWLETTGAALEAALDGRDVSASSYLRDCAAERRRRPGGDLVSWLAVGQFADRPLSDPEVIAYAGLLAGSAYDTMWGLVSNSVLSLLRHPDQLALVREDPSLVTSAIEELARHDAPSQVQRRWLLQDLQIEDLRVSGGSPVVLLLGAANRDPDRFREPDRLDFTRADPGSASFAPGADPCLGGALARLGAEAGLLVLLDHVPRLGPVVGALRWQSNPTRRELAALPVRI